MVPMNLSSPILFLAGTLIHAVVFSRIVLDETGTEIVVDFGIVLPAIQTVIGLLAVAVIQPDIRLTVSRLVVIVFRGCVLVHARSGRAIACFAGIFKAELPG